MHYTNIYSGKFISRPNRFIAHVELAGVDTICHVKNTGRCRELLIPGATVYVQKCDNPNRKTLYDLIAVKKGDLLINMDSQVPNLAAWEWICDGHLFPKGALVQREKTYGNSRFDLYVEYEERKAFIEVKGVTQEKEGVVLFPDAPTQRGLKHVEELIGCIREGYEAYLLLVIQMKGVKHFEPNRETDPAFSQALQKAADAGVHILAVDSLVTPDSLTLDAPVPVIL